MVSGEVMIVLIGVMDSLGAVLCSLDETMDPLDVKRLTWIVMMVVTIVMTVMTTATLTAMMHQLPHAAST